jgi:hypothetical protein
MQNRVSYKSRSIRDMLRPPPREPSPDRSLRRAPEEGGKRPRLGASSYGRWTDEEDEYLISQARLGMSHDDIAAHLRRGVKSIKTRLYIYGVHFPGDKAGLRAARAGAGGAARRTEEGDSSTTDEGSESPRAPSPPPPPALPGPSPEDEAVAEFRAHRQFGGYALERLGRTWHGILYEYGVPAHLLETLLARAGLRLDGARVVDPSAPRPPR